MREWQEKRSERELGAYQAGNVRLCWGFGFSFEWGWEILESFEQRSFRSYSCYRIWFLWLLCCHGLLGVKNGDRNLVLFWVRDDSDLGHSVVMVEAVMAGSWLTGRADVICSWIGCRVWKSKRRKGWLQDFWSEKLLQWRCQLIGMGRMSRKSSLEMEIKFSLGHIWLEMPTKQSHGGAEQPVGCQSLSSVERFGMSGVQYRKPLGCLRSSRESEDLFGQFYWELLFAQPRSTCWDIAHGLVWKMGKKLDNFSPGWWVLLWRKHRMGEAPSMVLELRQDFLQEMKCMLLPKTYK